MIQIFILGSSMVYGVGADQAGWADLVKQGLHQKMYGPNGVGEKYELYNFGKSGATVEFVQETFPQQLQQYGRGGTIITLVSVGGNNAKAVDEPDNFVSTIEEYATAMSELMDDLKQKSDHVVAVGGGYYDESKVRPKPNPLTGGQSWFSNQRKQSFQQRWKELCQDRKIPFVGVDMKQAAWLAKYIYQDGLHPNQKGHRYIADNVLRVLEELL